MDPPGFALESFDVMGGYRERYRAVSEKVPPVKGFGLNGQAFAFHHALPVDSAGALPDGRPFQDVRELKGLLVQDERQIARNLARQLTVFATGARCDSPIVRRSRPSSTRRGAATMAFAASSMRSFRATYSGTSRKDRR